uniref:Uncharacterized protein n=1 Tax=Arion vulgaris TaxID=1028688 RepID=A0A0B7AP74_9EUPU
MTEPVIPTSNSTVTNRAVKYLYSDTSLLSLRTERGLLEKHCSLSCPAIQIFSKLGDALTNPATSLGAAAHNMKTTVLTKVPIQVTIFIGKQGQLKQMNNKM